MPSESLIRKRYLDEVYQNVIGKIRKNIGNNFIWFTVDESTDARGRYIANLLVGVLNNNESSEPYLIASRQLEKTNNNTIARFVQEGLSDFFLPNRVPSEKIVLMLSDAATYMVKASNVLKVFYENLIHCTCLAHGLSRVAETVRLQFPVVNDLIKNGKKIFVKSPLRIQAFREQVPNVSLPPEPVLTRWGTWLEAALYYADYFHKFKAFVTDLDEASAQSIKECQRILNDKQVFQNLTFIKCHYSYIPQFLTKLETRDLSLTESVKIIDEFKTLIQNVHGNVGVMVNKKLEVLEKNSGFKILIDISKTLEGLNSSGSCTYFLHKMIFSYRRQNYSLENLEKYVIVNYFAKTTYADKN